MENFFFCARNVVDYVKPINDKSDIPIVDLADENLLDNPEVQNFFLNILKSYIDNDNWVTAPISNAIDTGLQGVKLDFNHGLRMEIPTGNWHVKISDFDSGEIIFERNVSDIRLHSFEKYYIHWQVELSLDGAEVFHHTFDATNRHVLVYFPPLGMGDIIAMLPYVDEFRRRYHCHMSIITSPALQKFVTCLYPELQHTTEINYDINYAVYILNMPSNILPIWYVDVRNYPLSRIAGVGLGINYLPPRPHFEPTMPPVTNDPYVCIAVQASMVRKGWFYPNGWDIVVAYLKKLGYRVFCIDRDKENSDEKIGLTNKMPEGAEDFTGNRPLIERANMLYYAEFFIGLSSGLAWIADAVKCPVVMICGFSKDWWEFYTPYRVANRLVCNGCTNDILVNYMSDTCPYHKDTPREFECQKKISARQVLGAIKRLIIDEHLTPPNLIKN